MAGWRGGSGSLRTFPCIVISLMKYLHALDDRSAHILREACARCAQFAVLRSMGKDSAVLLWLARKAVVGHVPFLLIHLEPGYGIPELTGIASCYAHATEGPCRANP